MSLSTVKTLSAKAEALLSKSQLRPLDELIDVCASGLGHISRENDAYCVVVSFGAKLLPHFTNELRQLVAVLERADAHRDKKRLADTVQEHAFALVEDMALFKRERKCREGYADMHPDAERVLTFFETSGNWDPKLHELVTDMYYNQIPIAVMQSLQARQRNLPALTLDG